MLTSVESISEIMIMLMKSTGRYIYHRIQVKAHKDIYASTLKKCINAVEANLTDYDHMWLAIDDIKKDINNHLKPRLFNNRKQEREYYYLACSHAVNIIESLNARFNTGTSDSEPRNYKNKGIVIPGDEGVF